MRYVLSVLLFFALFASCEAATTTATHACDLISETEVGALLGTTVRSKREEDTVICAGFCPMRGENTTECRFVSVSRTGPSVSLEVDPPPWLVSDWPKHAFDSFHNEDEHATVEKIEWPQGTAVWYFHPDQSHGFLDVFVGQRVWFEAIVDGVSDGHVAFGVAQRAVSKAQARYDSLEHPRR